MIIFQTKKPVESLNSNCVGVTGDNLVHTQEFYIKGIYDGSLTYSIHLRFADGSVNTVVPDSVQHDGEGTGLRWVVKKNDIFMHGYFELQIEGRNDEGLVFQTEIIELYADESIPIEDKEYEKPNSETLKLRDEAYELVQTLSEQQAKLEENAQLLEQYDLSQKLDDKESVITSSHIADYAVTAEKLYDGAVTTDKIEYGAVGEDELNSELILKINAKADKSTTLAGYGITDAYTKTETDTALAQKLDNSSGSVKTENIAKGSITSIKLANSAVSGGNIALNQISTDHLIAGCVTKAKLSDEVVQLIDSKYDASNIETGTGTLTVYEGQTSKVNSASFEYQKVGSWVDVHIYVDFKAFTPENGENQILVGLPFVCKNTVNPRELCVSTQKKKMLWAIASGSASITLLFFDTSAIVENEKLSFSLRYRIA